MVDAAIRDITGGERPDAIGHRVVHGGDRFSSPVRVTQTVMDDIQELVEFAPLHNAASATCMRAAAARWPRTPQVAVFDTAFHRTIPDHASRYAVPDELHTKYGIKRYGFHGISVEMACRHTGTYLGVRRRLECGGGAPWQWRLGYRRTGGPQRRHVHGHDPLEGLVMGTRSGDLDPSIVTLLQRRGLGPDEIDELLNHRAGLLGLAGSADMRAIQDAARQGDTRAILASDMAAYRLAKYIAAYNMVVGGAAALILTGGIGEHSSRFRSQVVSRLGPLGLFVDEARNRSAETGVRVISTDASAFPVLVVPSDEERAIAEATAAVVLSDESAIRCVNEE
ncbi:acetate kinase [Arthrobacter sp. Hiyo8]|nr:acetate kinase [Arthrobacter sp. Hiyo8]